MQVLDVAAVREWMVSSVHNLKKARAAINDINVYPIADGDTGSNLLHTLAGAKAELLTDSTVTTAQSALASVARGALANARGNSGVIMSQILRGFSDVAAEADAMDGAYIAEALRRADVLATAAVANAVPGTILTVLHTVATTITDTVSLSDVVTKSATVSAQALAETPNQLAVLAEAGVVDAGAVGLVVVLASLAEVVVGASADDYVSDEFFRRPAADTTSDRSATMLNKSVENPWEVMYSLDMSSIVNSEKADVIAELARSLASIGDSVSIAADGKGTYLVHVHCADIGAAIEYGLDIARPRHIRVESLTQPSIVDSSQADRIVFAVVHGDKLAELLRAESVHVIVVPEGDVPSSGDLISAIAQLNSGHITIVPSTKKLGMVAESVARDPMMDRRDVVVVPCSSPVQVLSALAVHDPQRKPHDDVVAMAEAAAATRRGELRIAAEEAIAWVGRAERGDLLGMINGEVSFIVPRDEVSDRLAGSAKALLQNMLSSGGELVTALTGNAISPTVVADLAEWLRNERPEIEFVSYPSGQDEFLLTVGVE